jgi:hypothetical protein
MFFVPSLFTVEPMSVWFTPAMLVVWDRDRLFYEQTERAQYVIDYDKEIPFYIAVVHYNAGLTFIGGKL